ncbi:tryptophan--tRNA ligase [Candidatus Aerophobetes bacterium]|uniref:Tryptophan--tRNA ligase n=1 Tax=Aerophobetes bacterium TaxID=2030807 RepID=A0A523QM99_UNCAE|nr:MAG: tryptophan--tRNA ligase [Candidatus Aerophobetes bacterium]
MGKERILSGMRPSGKLHLGNYLGALSDWVKQQDRYECFFMIADWHALTDRTDTRQIQQDTQDMLIDWLAAGLNPQESTLFLQSQIPEHAELHLILSMITPVSWLERCPTYKEKLEIGQENNYGLLGYPVLQTADILMYKASKVPVGEDQLPHLELSREIARRFNYLYGNIFPEPEPLRYDAVKVLGLDGKKKMSKSYGNEIALSEEPRLIEKKVLGMFTDPRKIYLKDPGHPEECNVYSYHRIFGPSWGKDLDGIFQDCREGRLPCTRCKKDLAQVLIKALAPFRERRKELEANSSELEKILAEGKKAASEVARATSDEVRKAMHISSAQG